MKTTFHLGGRVIATVDLIRAVLSVGFGAFLLSFHISSVVLLAWLLATLLVLDGAFDVFLQRRLRLDRSHLFIGLGDMVLGVITFVDHQLTLGLLVLAGAGFALLQGIGGLWRSLRHPDPSQKGIILWARAIGGILVAAALVLLARYLLIIAYVVLGLYLVLDGLARLLRIFAPDVFHLRSALLAQMMAEDETPPAATGLRAVVFLRRNGAMGLGHVGWAFEWKTGWFNAGSIENISGRAFAHPPDMNFWTLHTLDPVAAMVRQVDGYDEYKIFHVAEPQMKAAWETVVWESRTPYSVVRHNCADCVYDVLRTYGLTGMIDTARLNVPKDWYDALPGTSTLIADEPKIALHPWTLGRLLPGAPVDITLHIRPEEKGTPPPWRMDGGRFWYVAAQKVELIGQNILLFVRLVRTAVRARLAQRHAPPSAPATPPPTEDAPHVGHRKRETVKS